MPSGRRKFPAYAFYHLFWCAVDWLYPPTCGGCGKTGERWCAYCQAAVQKLNGDICPKCGIPSAHNKVCPACRKRPPDVTALRSWGKYGGPLREAIQRLKYKRDLGMAEPLAQQMVRILRQQNWPVDFITTVPLGRLRLHDRGYNQAKELAQPIAWMLGIPYNPGAIIRIRETRSQVGLSARERVTNVDGAFQAKPIIVTGKTILIIDDVATTGATVNACARSLIDSGARSVYALTLARALQVSDHSSGPS
jgi:ComF family protein